MDVLRIDTDGSVTTPSGTEVAQLPAHAWPGMPTHVAGVQGIVDYLTMPPPERA